ncbi:helix-turn-helix domain-containing protein [Nocardiopsis terrae]
MVETVAAELGLRIERARAAAGLSQRALADAMGISRSTLSRIISGNRSAKMPEAVAIAWRTEHTVAQLTGTGVASEFGHAAHAANDSGRADMRQTLLGFLELNAHLDDQAIPTPILNRADET